MATLIFLRKTSKFSASVQNHPKTRFPTSADISHIPIPHFPHPAAPHSDASTRVKKLGIYSKLAGRVLRCPTKISSSSHFLSHPPFSHFPRVKVRDVDAPAHSNASTGVKKVGNLFQTCRVCLPMSDEDFLILTISFPPSLLPLSRVKVRDVYASAQSNASTAVKEVGTLVQTRRAYPPKSLDDLLTLTFSLFGRGDPPGCVRGGACTVSTLYSVKNGSLEHRPL